MFLPVVAAVAAEPPPPMGVASITATRHARLCHRDVPWHCLLPAEGEALVRVEVALEVPWTAERNSVALKDEVIALAVGDQREPLIALAEGGWVYAASDRYLSRPYKWEQGAQPVELELVFAVPASATTGTLDVAGTTAEVALPEPLGGATDPLAAGAFEVRFGKWVDKAPTERVLAGVRVRDEVVAPCELLSVGVAIRALEGTAPSIFSAAGRLVVRSDQFAVSGARAGMVLPLELRVTSEWPDRQADLSISPGKEETADLLFCLPEREPVDLLYRGAKVGPVPFAEGALPAPPPPEPAGACSTGPGGSVVALLIALAAARRRGGRGGATV